MVVMAKGWGRSMCGRIGPPPLGIGRWQLLKM
jgi:hypothetical protein